MIQEEEEFVLRKMKIVKGLEINTCRKRKRFSEKIRAYERSLRRLFSYQVNYGASCIFCGIGYYATDTHDTDFWEIFGRFSFTTQKQKQIHASVRSFVKVEEPTSWSPSEIPQFDWSSTFSFEFIFSFFVIFGF